MIRLTLRKPGGAVSPDQRWFYVDPKDIAAIQTGPGLCWITLAGQAQVSTITVEETAEQVLWLRAGWYSRDSLYPDFLSNDKPAFIYLYQGALTLQMMPITLATARLPDLEALHAERDP